MCSLSATCEQPAELVVHGRGFVDPQDVRCRVGGAEGPDGANGFGAIWLDDATIQCNAMAAAPTVIDPAVGAVLDVEVSIDGGSTWTRATPEASYTVPCTRPPASPPSPPSPPPSPPPPPDPCVLLDGRTDLRADPSRDEKEKWCYTVCHSTDDWP